MKQKRWKPKFGEIFYVINASMLQGFIISKQVFRNAVGLHKAITKSNYCFHTKKEAEAKLKLIKQILGG